MKMKKLLLLCTVLVAVATAQAAKRPNVVLVITDDQGYGDLSCHGNPVLKTPNLDKLHSESVRLTDYHVAPTCSPSRAALITGHWTNRTGVWHTIMGRSMLRANEVTIGQIMGDGGYHTGMFGKWHLGDNYPYRPEDRGFQEVLRHGGGGVGQTPDFWDNAYFDGSYFHNGKPVPVKGFCSDVFFDYAKRFIRKVKNDEKPFFIYLCTNAPHGPFIAPPKNTKRFTDLGFEAKTAGFYGMIENIDENMGHLLARMEEWKLFENTILIFMSDNGMTGGGGGRPGKPVAKGHPFFNAGQKGLKGSVDEGGVRVPFFVRWDGKYATRDINELSAHIDILPTLAAVAGAKLPENQVGGRSLLPLLLGQKIRTGDRYLFSQKARWPTGSEPDRHQWSSFAVRNSRYRLVGKQLFDMVTDPGQKTDVADRHPEVVKEMRAAYDRFWQEARPLMVNEEAPMSKTRPFHVWYNQQMEQGGIPNWVPPEL